MRKGVSSDATLWLIELNDPMLRPLILASTENEREREIGCLFVHVIAPTLDRVIGRFAADAWQLDSDAAEDIGGDIALRLLEKLKLVATHEEEAIERFQDYVEILAQNSVYDYLRKRFPARSRLRSRLRYLLTKEERFSLTASPMGSIVGLRQWDQSRGVATRIDIAITSHMRDASRPVAAIAEVFRSVGKPVRFEALVSMFAAIWQVEELDDAVPQVQSADVPLVTRFETRESLELLWEEISALPPLQRAALLLNLRDPDGVNVIPYFLLLGITKVDPLSAAVGLTPQSLSELWHELPLDDLTIAARLNVTRQQVINLRKAARERLARRMAARTKGRQK